MHPLRGIILTIALASLSVIAFGAFTGMFKPIRKNGFTRIFLKELKVDNSVEKPEDLRIYVGAKSNRLYFATKEVNQLYSCDYRLQAFKKERLEIPITQKWQNNYRHFIVGDSLYSWAPQIPALYSMAIQETKGLNVIKLPYTFTRGQRIGPNSLLIRSFYPADSAFEQRFIKYNSNAEILFKNEDVTEHLNDGGMLTDGMLHYDSLNHLAVYVHFFSNQLIWLDSNLKVLKRGHTIDTFAHIDGKMEVFKKGNAKKATYSSPPRMVNLYSQVYKGLLFNYSARRADNEEEEGYIGGSKIDLYRLDDGRYLGTLKIPSIAKETMDSFSLIDGHLIAIYQNHIVLYALDLGLFVPR